MKPFRSVLLATTAVIGALGLPALASMPVSSGAQAPCASGLCSAVSGKGGQSVPLIRVSGDDDQDHERGRARRGHDDEDCDDDDDEDDDDDDDDGCTGALGNPAPAGTVAPPANGLFGTGAPPVAVTN